jgi:hypothetical protein
MGLNNHTKPMQIDYALHERLANGYGWSWHFGELPEPLLNDFFYRLTPPNNSNTINTNDLRGGIYRFDKWTILYRFFDGGKDNGGRPNRNVMLTAWIQTQDIAGRNVDLLQIFRNKTFQWVQEHSKTIGIDRPFTLSETIHLSEPPTVSNAVYNDFIRNLADEDNDYHLIINNERFTLEKKPCSTLKKECSELEKECSKLKKENSELEKERSKLKKELSELKEKCSELEKEYSEKKYNWMFLKFIYKWVFRNFIAVSVVCSIFIIAIFSVVSYVYYLDLWPGAPPTSPPNAPQPNCPGAPPISPPNAPPEYPPIPKDGPPQNLKPQHSHGYGYSIDDPLTRDKNQNDNVPSKSNNEQIQNKAPESQPQKKNNR